MSQPFLAVHTDVTDETTQKTCPTILAGQDVLITQDQQRQIFDTIRTTVTPNPYAQKLSFSTYPTSTPVSVSCSNGHASNIYPTNFPIRAEKRFVPGGVSFIFKPQQQYEPFRFEQYAFQPNTIFSPMAQYPQQFNQSLAWQPNSLHQEIMLSELRKHGIETLKYQQHMQNQPFNLQFHKDQGTCTPEMYRPCVCYPQSNGCLPDFSNASASVGNRIYMDSSYNGYNYQPSSGYDSYGKNSQFPPPTSVFPDPKQLTIRSDFDKSYKTMNIFDDLARSQMSTPIKSSIGTSVQSPSFETTVPPPPALISEDQKNDSSAKTETPRDDPPQERKVSFTGDVTNTPARENASKANSEGPSKSDEVPLRKKPDKKKKKRNYDTNEDKISFSSSSSGSENEANKTISDTDLDKKVEE